MVKPSKNKDTIIFSKNEICLLVMTAALMTRKHGIDSPDLEVQAACLKAQAIVSSENGMANIKHFLIVA